MSVIQRLDRRWPSACFCSGHAMMLDFADRGALLGAYWPTLSCADACEMLSSLGALRRVYAR